jgi:membrane protein
MDRGRAVELVRAIVKESRSENLTFMAGSIAYHAFVSLLPLLVLVVVALESVGGSGLSELVLGIVQGALTEEGRNLIVDAARREARLSGVSVLGLAVLVWATLRIFRSFDQAFSDIYETERRNSILDQLVDGVVVFGAVAAAVVLTALVRTQLTFGAGFGGTAFKTAFVVTGLALALLPMYYVFPDADVRVVEVLPGTAVAAVGVTTLEALFRVYVEFSSTAESYGLVGAIVVLVTWLYFNGLVLLLGAVVNAVLTNRTRDVVIEPVLGDYRVGLAEGTGDGGVPTALADLEATADGAGSVTLTVDGREVTLPSSASVSVEGDPGSEGEVVIRW